MSSTVFVRPDVSDLIIHLYERPVHPELLEIHDEIAVVEDGFACTIRLLNAGHAVEFRTGNTLVTEVLTSQNAPLPQQRLTLQHRVRGSRETEQRFSDELLYQSCFQVERVDAEVYLNFHRELQFDFRRASVAREFPTAGRFTPGAISLIRTEVCADSFLIHTYHTYPDNCAIVKTQTLFEFPGD